MSRTAGGLQPERTALAWQRTTFGLLANGGLFALRSTAGTTRSVPALVLATALTLLAAVVAVVGARRERMLARGEVARVPRRDVQVVGGLLVAVCLAGAVVLALPLA